MFGHILREGPASRGQCNRPYIINPGALKWGHLVKVQKRQETVFLRSLLYLSENV